MSEIPLALVAAVTHRQYSVPHRCDRHRHRPGAGAVSVRFSCRVVGRPIVSNRAGRSPAGSLHCARPEPWPPHSYPCRLPARRRVDPCPAHPACRTWPTRPISPACPACPVRAAHPACPASWACPAHPAGPPWPTQPSACSAYPAGRSLSGLLGPLGRPGPSGRSAPAYPAAPCSSACCARPAHPAGRPLPTGQAGLPCPRRLFGPRRRSPTRSGRPGSAAPAGPP